MASMHAALLAVSCQSVLDSLIVVADMLSVVSNQVAT